MEANYKALLNSFLGLVIVCDDEGNIVVANNIALELLEYSDEELEKITVENLFLEKNFSIKDLIEQSKLKPIITNTSIYRHNTTCFPVRIKVTYDMENKHGIIVAYENSELIQAQKETGFINEKIQEAMKVKDEFTANVTHELRTPVNGIKGHTQYLLQTELSKDQEKELKIINECCLNMEKLINNILDFSKLEAGKFALSEREFKFSECINYITETNGKLIEEKGLRFIVNVDPGIPEELFGDDFRLIQIMNNLLSNALKFTQKGYIAIEVTKSMQYGKDIELFFMVMDTGIGIPADKKDALFQSFTQVDASISRTYGGTGLGLAITKQLVELMSGSIRLESEFGKGSTFTFTVRMKLPENAEVIENDEFIKPMHIDHAERIRKVMEDADKINIFGTKENIEEFYNISENLILCIDMENYEKAEQFADSIKSLVMEGPQNLKQLAFRMTMMVRKEDGEQARNYYEQLVSAMKEALDGKE